MRSGLPRTPHPLAVPATESASCPALPPPLAVPAMDFRVAPNFLPSARLVSVNLRVAPVPHAPVPRLDAGLRFPCVPHLRLLPAMELRVAAKLASFGGADWPILGCPVLRSFGIADDLLAGCPALPIFPAPSGGPSPGSPGYRALLRILPSVELSGLPRFFFPLARRRANSRSP